MTTTTLTEGEITYHVDERRASRCPYTFVLVYVQEFTSGTLEGTCQTASLPWASESAAVQWVAAINDRHTRGKLPYRVIEHVVRAL